MEVTLKKHNIEIFKNGDEVFVECRNLESFLGLSNIRGTISCFTNEEKRSLIRKDRNGISRKTSCLTEEGFKHVICLSRKPIAIQIANELGLYVLHKYVAAESSFVQLIQETFFGECILIQYVVDKYYIDLFFPKYNLAVEFDEHRHKWSAGEDVSRQKYISDQIGCTFLRVSESESVFRSINRIFTVIKNSILSEEISST